MASFKLTYENLLYLVLGLLSIIIIYKLLTGNTKQGVSMSNARTEEGFQGVISKFKNTRNAGKSILKTGSNSSKTKKGKKKQAGVGMGMGMGGGSKVSFDDIVREAEEMDPSRYTVDSIKDSFFTYLESFQKAKFKNITGTTDEALEKFGFFKDQFFNIFK